MNKIIFFLVCLVASMGLCAQTTQEIDLLKQKYIHSICGKEEEKEVLIQRLSMVPPEKEVSDQNVIELQQLYPISPKELRMLLKTMRADGSWKEIDYADDKRSGWAPKTHAERLLKLAKCYHQKREEGKADEAEKIATAIHRAMDFWFTQKPVCKNWWYNEIGVPRTLGPAFLLFEEQMDKREKELAIEVMMHSKFGMTGQNKVWLAGNVLIRGLLQNDWELVKEAREVIASEIVLGQKEGIKPDWSFHQHGAQQQFGNYGLSFICNISFYAELFAQTSLALSAEQQQILTSFLLKGYQWIVWRGYWDVNGLNRQLFRNADVDKSFRLLFAAHSLMKSSSEKEAEEIRTFIDRNFFNRSTDNTFTGNKFFECSDLTIHRTPQWMASLRMASDRVIGTELVNEDNLKGYYMADGALYIYVRGDEYHNIFPFIDWRKIPGITTYQSNAPIPTSQETDARNRSSLVGASTDGTTGITAMQLKRNKLTAHKAWIFTGEYVLCLGSNIQADSTANLLTCIDQRFAKGRVWKQGKERFFHDGTGYVVLQADSCIATTEKRQGEWRDFMGMYKPQLLNDRMFTLYLKHRKDSPASYGYVILPACTKEKTQRFDTRSIQILRNDGQAQVVVIMETTYLAIYEETEVSLADGTVIKDLKPGTYMINR